LKIVVFRASDGSVSVDEVPPPQLTQGSLLIRNEFSAISAGTERARLATGEQTLLGKARSRPDQVKKVLDSARRAGVRETYEVVRDRLDRPSPIGYSCVGKVEGVGAGVAGFRVGQRVAAAGAGYANHAEVVCVPRNLCVPVPDGVGSRDASFTTIGAIALHGIHQAHVQMGSRVAVVGLGLVGQLTVRALAAYGADVIGIDVDERMLELARAAAITALDRGDPSLDESLGSQWGGAGADAVILAAATKDADPVKLAGQIARDRGTVVIVGDTPAEAPRSNYYGKELSIKHSRSYGPGRYDPSFEERGVEYPAGYVPWTERRNMEEFLRLLDKGLIEVESLSPVVMPVERAAEVYGWLKKGGRERRIAIALSYGSPSADLSSVPLPPPREREHVSSAVRVAAIGAGSFPSRLLFPPLKDSGRVKFTWITSSSGLTAKRQGTRFGFARAVSDIEDGLQLDGTDAVMVLSLHDTHARYAVRVLEAGKALFCEKPLALTEADLDSLAIAWRSSGAPALAGFNRRFAPAIRVIREATRGGGSLQISYRVFAGVLRPDHWAARPEQGGRILGEVCHFVDTVGFLVGANPTAVTAQSPEGQDPIASRSVSALIEYSNGSSATIEYAGGSPSGAPKEFMEVAGDGIAARMDDFRLVTMWGRRKGQRRFKGGPKGHREEMAAFVDVVAGHEVPDADFRLSLWSSLATLRLAQSVTRAERVEIAPATPGLSQVLASEATRGTV
jgi:predicted dehydrogenase/threonine dehydrogenase-like Zn-dependent dehydrogenase